jgi:hypothetical protein
MIGQGRVVDLVAVEIRDRQHRSIADQIEGFVDVPRGAQGYGLASPSPTTAATIRRKFQITGKLREAPSLNIASDIGSPGNIVHDGRAIF